MHAAARRRGSSPLYPAGGKARPEQHVASRLHAGAPPQSPGLFGSPNRVSGKEGLRKRGVVWFRTVHAAEGRRDWGTEFRQFARPPVARRPGLTLPRAIPGTSSAVVATAYSNGSTLMDGP